MFRFVCQFREHFHVKMDRINTENTDHRRLIAIWLHCRAAGWAPLHYRLQYYSYPILTLMNIYIHNTRRNVSKCGTSNWNCGDSVPQNLHWQLVWLAKILKTTNHFEFLPFADKCPNLYAKRLCWDSNLAYILNLWDCAIFMQLSTRWRCFGRLRCLTYTMAYIDVVYWCWDWRTLSNTGCVDMWRLGGRQFGFGGRPVNISSWLSDS